MTETLNTFTLGVGGDPADRGKRDFISDILKSLKKPERTDVGRLSLETKVPYAHRDWQKLRKNTNKSVHGARSRRSSTRKPFSSF